MITAIIGAAIIIASTLAYAIDRAADKIVDALDDLAVVVTSDDDDEETEHKPWES